jgi:hypothetical protein
MPILKNDHIRAEIVTRGAELIRLQDASGADFLWSGDPIWWSGRAPILFPIVGKVRDDKASRRDRARPDRANFLHGLFNQMEGAKDERRKGSTSPGVCAFPPRYRYLELFTLRTRTPRLSCSVRPCLSGTPSAFGSSR